MKFLAEKLDLFSPKPELKVEGKPKFRTKFGVFMGTISIVILIVIYIFYLFECLSRTKLNVSYNEKTNMKPIIPLKNKKISFSLFHGFGEEFHEQERLISLSARYLKTTFIDISKENSEYFENPNLGEIIDIPLKKCNKFIDDSFSNAFSQISLFKPNTVCLELDNFKEDIFGTYGSLDK